MRTNYYFVIKGPGKYSHVSIELANRKWFSWTDVQTDYVLLTGSRRVKSSYGVGCLVGTRKNSWCDLNPTSAAIPVEESGGGLTRIYLPATRFATMPHWMSYGGAQRSRPQANFSKASGISPPGAWRTRGTRRRWGRSEPTGGWRGSRRRLRRRRCDWLGRRTAVSINRRRRGRSWKGRNIAFRARTERRWFFQSKVRLRRGQEKVPLFCTTVSERCGEKEVGRREREMVMGM